MSDVLLIRHGTTDLNDPKNEKIRGYSDIPLSYDGIQSVKRALKFLQDNNITYAKVLSSPLQRAMMTASIVADDRAKVIPNKGLLPWNLGDLMEKPIKQVASKMDYLQEYPDLKAPRGESYRSFYDRWSELLNKMLDYTREFPDETLVGVVHSRNLLALPSILDGTSIGDVPVKGGPKPASVIKISSSPQTGFEHKIIWAGE